MDENGITPPRTFECEWDISGEASVYVHQRIGRMYLNRAKMWTEGPLVITHLNDLVVWLDADEAETLGRQLLKAAEYLKELPVGSLLDKSVASSPTTSD